MTAIAPPPPMRQMKVHLVEGVMATLKDVGSTDHGRSDWPARLADTLLADAVRERATDIHFEPHHDGVLVRLRIDGGLYDTLLLSNAEGTRAIRHFKAIAGIDSSQHFVPSNARISWRVDDRPIDLRVASVPCLGGEALTIRLLDPTQMQQRLDDLGLAEAYRKQLEDWISGAFGLFLVVGPTGNGKTTTLYALLHELRSRDRAVFTIEDPIEYRIDGVTQMQVDPHHGLTFAAGLQAMLRLDPDHLLLGEIRDEQAARAAAEAAGGGRVLMSTMSCVDAVGTVGALRTLGLSDHEIAAGLRCVVAQRLVRRLCPNCRRPVAQHDKTRLPAGADGTGWAAVGCANCRGLGYVGRTGVFEIWALEGEDRALIQAHAGEEAIRERLLRNGFCTLISDGAKKARQGLVAISEIERLAVNYPGANRLQDRRTPDATAKTSL